MVARDECVDMPDESRLLLRCVTFRLQEEQLIREELHRMKYLLLETLIGWFKDERKRTDGLVGQSFGTVYARSNLVVSRAGYGLVNLFREAANVYYLEHRVAPEVA